MIAAPDARASSGALGVASLVVAATGAVIVIAAIGIARIISNLPGVGLNSLLWSAIAVMISGAALLVCGTVSLALGLRAARQGRGREPAIAGAVLGGLSLAFLLYFVVRIIGADLGLWAY